MSSGPRFLAGSIDVVPVQNRNLSRALQLSINLGESATLALALERQEARVILHD